MDNDVQEKPAQLPLDLPDADPRYEASCFCRSESNDAAWRTGHAWLRSEEPALIICGPAGAGKTHLAHVIAEEIGKRDEGPAVFVSGAIFSDDVAPAPFLIVDGLPPASAHAFLEAYETAASKGPRMVFIGRGHPSEWALGLKDLRTRLEAMPRAVLSEPDEALIRSVIAKAFADRQLRVSERIIDYAAARLPRTFAAAHAFVALADRKALEERRKITSRMVQNLLDNLSEGAIKA